VSLKDDVVAGGIACAGHGSACEELGRASKNESILLLPVFPKLCHYQEKNMYTGLSIEKAQNILLAYFDMLNKRLFRSKGWCG
jgi:hypothetical protein